MYIYICICMCILHIYTSHILYTYMQVYVYNTYVTWTMDLIVKCEIIKFLELNLREKYL